MNNCISSKEQIFVVKLLTQNQKLHARNRLSKKYKAFSAFRPSALIVCKLWLFNETTPRRTMAGPAYTMSNQIYVYIWKLVEMFILNL